jgi:signal transduction histidine kinase/ligand-binding sensor domain-containing protein/CheY-like chemotaxis protein
VSIGYAAIVAIEVGELRMRLRPLGLAALLVLAAPARALAPVPLFRVIGTAEGLPSAQVYEVAGDARGYLWFATADGLARYDGSGFAVWRHDPEDPASLPDNAVQTLYIDRADQVWVGTEDGGLAVLDPARRGFRHWRASNNGSAALATDDVWAITQAPDGAIWVGGYASGLARIDAAGAVHRLAGTGDPVLRPPGDTIIALAVDAAGWLWVASDQGATAFRLGADGFPAQAQAYLAGVMVTSIDIDAAGRVWLGTRDALHSIAPRSAVPGALEPVPLAPAAPVRPILDGVADDGVGGHWIGTRRGLIARSPAGATVLHHYAPATPGSLPGNSVNDVYRDREGGTWIAIVGVGVAYLPPHWRNFSLLRADDPGGIEAGSGWEPPFARCPDGGLWMARSDGGLWRVDPLRGTRSSIHANDILPLVPAGERVRALACTREGLWLSHTRGLARLDAAGGKVETLAADAAVPTAPAPGAANLSAVDADGAVWIALTGGALQRLDPATGALRRFMPGVDGPRDGELEQLAFDRAGRLWTAGKGGIDRFDPGSDRFIAIEGVPAGRIDGLAFDAAGSLWLHTLTELVQGEVEGTRFVARRRVGAEQGLPVARVAGLSIDGAGHVWLPGARGLLRYDPGQGSVRAYGVAEGLADLVPGKHVVQQGGDGLLVFGHASGVIAFDPARLEELRVAPPVVLATVDTLRDGQRRALDPAAPIVLDHRDGELRIAARALSYADPRANRYRFRMEGLEREWHDNGTRAERVYAQLPPGDYRLHVAGAGPGGDWSELAAPLQVRVATPPWRHPLAWLGYAAALALLAWLALRAWRARLERRHALALADARRQSAELQSQAKSEFLADVGHEIRTPMSGLLGMTELLLRTRLDERQRNHARTIQRSGEHLLKLINDLLDLSRIESGRLELAPQVCDLRTLVDEVTAMEAPLAAERGLDFWSGVGDDVPARVVIDPLRLQQVLLNLVNNALKFTGAGRVTLAAGLAAEAGAELVFAISDTGPGMSEANVARLFTRFEQGGDGLSSRGGSGLGLAISRRLVELMGGRITVESQVGAGTTFRVALPLVVAAAETAGAVAAAGRTLPVAPRNVLVVEDDATMRAVLVGLLQDLGHAVEAGANGLDALRLSGERVFDLAYIDLDLPGVDGLRLVRMLRKREAQAMPRIHMVAITARSEPDVAARCRDAGFDAFLRKPITCAALEASLAEALHAIGLGRG